MLDRRLKPVDLFLFLFLSPLPTHFPLLCLSLSISLSHKHTLISFTVRSCRCMGSRSQKMEVWIKILFSSICHSDLTAWKGLTTRERGKRAAPVEILRAGGQRRAGESLVDEEGAVELILPHVNVAFSLCLGQGRTLKGRDLARVRDSVLRMTGFLEG